MASTNGGGKEERRRRIAERGSDRMALITGRINALPPTPPSTASSPTHRHIPRHVQSLSAATTFDSNSDNENDNLPPRHFRPQSALPFGADYPENLTGDNEGKRPNIFAGRLKHQSGFRYSHLENLEFKSEEEPLIQDNSDTISEVNNQVPEAGGAGDGAGAGAGDGDGDKIKPPSITSEAENENKTHDTQQPKKPCRDKPTFFSSREINSCIIASENTRALSSLTIALLVVFYYIISESILASRPLYIVLITDITIVIARLHREKPRLLEETEGEKVKTPGDDKHSWGDAVKLLERGLVVYQAIRGFFIDCSIYLVVVVCGISLM